MSTDNLLIKFLRYTCEDRNQMYIINTCKELILTGSNVNEQDNSGHTPLHYAIIEPSIIEVCDLLIKSGANINLQNNRGDTPLHMAAQNNNFDIAEILVKAGADKSIKNNDGKTPLECVEPDLIELLTI